MPYFSVVIPVYNKAAFISETIKSVLAQSFTDFELILVNDGSTDESAKIIARFKDDRIRYFEKKNSGASAARNFGIEQSAANYIAFLDADDYWYPDFLQETCNSIQNFPTEKIFAGAIEIEMPEKIFPAQYSFEKKPQAQLVNYFDGSQKTTAICTSCVAFDKSIFDEIGNFDTEIRSGQDTDLWIRMGLVYPVVFCSKILARYVYDPESLSKNNSYLGQNLNFSKFSAEEQNNPKLKKFLDQNRFSFAIKCRLNNDSVNYDLFKNAIELSQLSPKKKILLELPSFLLRFLLKVNLLLVRLGLSKSAFK